MNVADTECAEGQESPSLKYAVSVVKISKRNRKVVSSRGSNSNEPTVSVHTFRVSGAYVSGFLAPYLPCTFSATGPRSAVHYVGRFRRGCWAHIGYRAYAAVAVPDLRASGRQKRLCMCRTRARSTV